MECFRNQNIFLGDVIFIFAKINMDQDIGMWIEKLQYVWDEENKKRLYIVPNSFFLVDKENVVSRLSKDKELYLFPMPKDCARNLAAVYTGPLNFEYITRKFGKDSLRMEGRILDRLRNPVHQGTFWIGAHSRTSIPFTFYGKDPKTVKSPLVNTKTREVYDNLWDIQKKKKLRKHEVYKIHSETLERRGDYKYFWQTFTNKSAMELGRQTSFVSFAFFLL
ncbi:hypothetical protein ISTM_17 [Insectomime virus]|uniref:Uncharacterized protein n=1 Tax=Tunisvirus fontaine2 TaxID=1421067 RepID=V9SGX6_9VIRU|nr:hypothetical protein D1R32_gp310 [Tunisvirus fontaine2]AHA45915.1 hypothetical protein ISTM_17 [Insectomime virus]AHC55027.1 hypothetical protein TNS_ORF309 [Tunisvirus fontaine2]